MNIKDILKTAFIFGTGLITGVILNTKKQQIPLRSSHTISKSESIITVQEDYIK